MAVVGLGRFCECLHTSSTPADPYINALLSPLSQKLPLIVDEESSADTFSE